MPVLLFEKVAHEASKADCVDAEHKDDVLVRVVAVVVVQALHPDILEARAIRNNNGNNSIDSNNNYNYDKNSNDNNNNGSNNKDNNNYKNFNTTYVYTFYNNNMKTSN